MPVQDILDATADAYSLDRYGRRQWRLAANELYGRGLTEAEVATILNSVWPRYAADNAADGERPTADDLVKFIDDPRNRFNLAKLMGEYGQTLGVAPRLLAR